MLHNCTEKEQPRENTTNNKHNEAETYVKINYLSYNFPRSGSSKNKTTKITQTQHKQWEYYN